MGDRIASLISENRMKGFLEDFPPKCFVVLLEDIKGFPAHLEDTKMKRNSKKEASVSDFWGGMA